MRISEMTARQQLNLALSGDPEDDDTIICTDPEHADQIEEFGSCDTCGGWASDTAEIGSEGIPVTTCRETDACMCPACTA